MSDATLHDLRNELQALRLGLPAYALLVEQGRHDDARAAKDAMLGAIDRVEAIVVATDSGGEAGA